MSRRLGSRRSTAGNGLPRAIPVMPGPQMDLAAFTASLGLAYDPARIPANTAGSAPAPWLDVPSHPKHARIAQAIVTLGAIGQQHRSNELFNAVM